MSLSTLRLHDADDEFSVLCYVNYFRDRVKRARSPPKEPQHRNRSSRPNYEGTLWYQDYPDYTVVYTRCDFIVVLRHLCIEYVSLLCIDTRRGNIIADDVIYNNITIR